MQAPRGRGVQRLVAVMHLLRAECPWDAEQTHASLVPYLIEETAEVVEAIEAGSDAALREELGDLLLQVVFHAEIAAEHSDGFDLDAIADGIADKLIRRHPYVFAGAGVPTDLMGSWEQRKAAEKGRSSVLDGIPNPLSALARAAKVVARARLGGVRVDLASESVSADTLGPELLELVARAQASGVDPDQALRSAIRDLERRIASAEAQG